LSSKAYLKAVQLLARRAHSREELRRKLANRFLQGDIEKALTKLENQKFLDDKEFAKERSESLRNHKNWGNLRIRHDLQRLGVGAKIIESTLARLQEKSPEEKGLERAISSWKRIYGNPRTASKLKKLYNHCLRLGYPSQLIRQKLDTFFRNLDWNES
jgi:regulatory protein